jgi:hypothetical protein
VVLIPKDLLSRRGMDEAATVACCDAQYLFDRSRSLPVIRTTTVWRRQLVGPRRSSGALPSIEERAPLERRGPINNALTVSAAPADR